MSNSKKYRKRTKRLQAEKRTRIESYTQALFISWQTMGFWARLNLAKRILFKTDLRFMKRIEKMPEEKRAAFSAKKAAKIKKAVEI